MPQRYDPEKSIMKANVVKELSNENQIDAITYLRPDEIEKIATIKAIIDDENKDRMKLGLIDKETGEGDRNILEEKLYNFVSMRRAVNGFRSEQFVKVMNVKVSEETQGKTIDVKGAAQ